LGFIRRFLLLIGYDTDPSRQITSDHLSRMGVQCHIETLSVDTKDEYHMVTSDWHYAGRHHLIRIRSTMIRSLPHLAVAISATAIVGVQGRQRMKFSAHGSFTKCTATPSMRWPDCRVNRCEPGSPGM